MAKLYTRNLFEVPFAAANTPYFSPSVPAGFVWVVTDVVVVAGGQPFTNAGGFSLITNSNAMIFGKANGHCFGATFYHWTGRQVVGQGTVMRFISVAAGSNMKTTGWELTTP